MQNIMSNMMPNKDAGSADGVPWYMKYVTKIAAVAAGVAAIFFGLWCMVGFSVLCIVGGVYQMLIGFLVIVIEAPFCCMFLDFVQQIAAAAEGRPVWQKAALYLALCIPTFLLCRQFTTFIGTGAIFGVAVLYGMQVIGKKASREEMAAATSAPPPSSSSGKPENMKSNLVGNIHGQDVEAAKG